jgi:DNA-binding GntR family transcriptional regulator
LSITTADKIAADLRECLAEGRIAPGERLSQAELARRYGVSIIPVREALARLASEGLVVFEANRGAFAAHLSLADVRELFDLRLMLELYLVRQAALKIAAPVLRRLQSVHAELNETDRQADWLRLDAEFHRLIQQAAESPRSLRLLDGLRVSIDRYYRALLTPADHRPDWQGDHEDLLIALHDRNPAAAEAALHRHLSFSAQCVLERLTLHPVSLTEKKNVTPYR